MAERRRWPEIVVPGLELEARPDRDRYRPGESIRGRVRLRNRGPDGLVLAIGAPCIGALIDAEGTRVGGFRGALGGIERGYRLAPGADDEVGFVAGSATAGPGGVLPPGDYCVVVRLDITFCGELGPFGSIETEPVPVELHDP